jgi:hypothetical protein
VKNYGILSFERKPFPRVSLLLLSATLSIRIGEYKNKGSNLRICSFVSTLRE